MKNRDIKVQNKFLKRFSNAQKICVICSSFMRKGSKKQKCDKCLKLQETEKLKNQQ